MPANLERVIVTSADIENGGGQLLSHGFASEVGSVVPHSPNCPSQYADNYARTVYHLHQLQRQPELTLTHFSATVYS